jgi:hypothetical protein
MAHAFEHEVLQRLCDAIAGIRSSAARAFRQAEIADSKTWEDGSVHFSLKTPLALTPEDRMRLTGTHAGLPFELHVTAERRPLLGVVWFDASGLVPSKVEVNAIAGVFDSSKATGFSVSLASPGLLSPEDNVEA